MVFRTDATRLGKFERTAVGYRVPASFSRTGVYKYLRAGRWVSEYRPPDEVFSPEALASFAMAPVTIGHPPGDWVSPATYRTVTHGSVVGATGRETVDGDEYVTGDLVVMSTEAIGGAQASKYVELSAGYTCDFDPTPGISPAGQPYDGVQRNIRINHVALLPEGKGRAGKHARLRADGNEITEESMDPIELAKLQAELAKAQADLIKATARADAAEAELATASARADKAEADLKTETAEVAKEKGRADGLDAELAPLRTSAAQREIADLVKRAAKVLPKEYSAAGKTAHQVRSDALEAIKYDAGARKDNEVFVAGYFDARFAPAAEGHDYNQTPKRTDAVGFDLASAHRDLK